MAAAARPTFATLERAAKIPPPGLHRRRESDEDAGTERRQQREAGGRPPDPDLRDARQVGWPDREKRRNQHSRDEKAGRTAKDAENRRFAQHVPDDARARCTERGAHRQFPLPRRGADEEEVGQVGARDQQDDDHGAEEHPEHGRGPAADLVVQPGHAHRGVGAVRVRVLVTQPSPDRGEIVGRLRVRGARLQPRDHPQESLRAVAAPCIDRRRIGHDEIDVADQRHEVRPQDADDGEGLAVENDRRPDRIRALAKPPLPHAVAHQRNGPPLVVGLYRPPKVHTRAGDVEVVGGHAHGREPLGLARAGQVGAPSEQRGDPLERPVGLGKVGEIGQGEWLTVGSRTDDAEGEEPIRLAEWQRTEHDRLHQRVDRGVGADRQGQHADHARGKRRLAAPGTEGVAEVHEGHACEHTNGRLANKAHSFARIDESNSWTSRSGICR